MESSLILTKNTLRHNLKSKNIFIKEQKELEFKVMIHKQDEKQQKITNELKYRFSIIDQGLKDDQIMRSEKQKIQINLMNKLAEIPERQPSGFISTSLSSKNLLKSRRASNEYLKQPNSVRDTSPLQKLKLNTYGHDTLAKDFGREFPLTCRRQLKTYFKTHSSQTINNKSGIQSTRSSLEDLSKIANIKKSVNGKIFVGDLELSLDKSLISDNHSKQNTSRESHCKTNRDNEDHVVQDNAYKLVSILLSDQPETLIRTSINLNQETQDVKLPIKSFLINRLRKYQKFQCKSGVKSENSELTKLKTDYTNLKNKENENINKKSQSRMYENELFQSFHPLKSFKSRVHSINLENKTINTESLKSPCCGPQQLSMIFNFSNQNLPVCMRANNAIPPEQQSFKEIRCVPEKRN